MSWEDVDTFSGCIYFVMPLMAFKVMTSIDHRQDGIVLIPCKYEIAPNSFSPPQVHFPLDVSHAVLTEAKDTGSFSAIFVICEVWSAGGKASSVSRDFVNQGTKNTGAARRGATRSHSTTLLSLRRAS